MSEQADTTSQAREPMLAGIRVLDLTQFMSGPFATQILGDLGAEIIKVEPPEGDSSRVLPPHYVDGDSVYYLCLNRGKHSVAIDLKSAAGQDLLRSLALSCDVIIENFRPGVLARLGLDYEELKLQRPGVVWCSISGFGQDGPDRDLPAYDMMVQAISGGMSLTGEPGGEPVRAGLPIGDLGAGLYAAVAVLAALNRKLRNGYGEHIDISMLDCQVALLTYQAAYWLQGGANPGPQGRGHDSIPSYRSFKARDGVNVVVGATTERMFEALAKLLGLEWVLRDARFRSNPDRNANREALMPVLEMAFRDRDATEWIDLIRGQGIPVARVNTVAEVLCDPQVQHRAMVAQLQADDGRSVRVSGNPIRFASSRTEPARYPPRLGEDASLVLGSLLGLGQAAIDELTQRGVLRSGDDHRRNSAA